MSVRTYRGASPEQRRADRRARLLAAALEAVGEVGVIGITVESVCARAGLTKRYFYEEFADRDAVLLAVAEDVYSGLREVIVTAVRSERGDARARAARAVRVFTEALDANPGVARLFAESPGHPHLLCRRDHALDEFAELVLDEVLRLPEEERARLRIAAMFVVAGSTQLVARWLAGGTPLGRGELIEEITRTGIRALLG